MSTAPGGAAGGAAGDSLSPAERNAAARARATALVAASSAERALPLHAAVWDGDERALRAALSASPPPDLEAVDPRGNTPLLLALKLERVHLVHVLIGAGASALARDREGFSAFQEAVQLPGRAGIDAHRATLRALLAETWARTEAKLAALCAQLDAIPDVDLEIHWQFSSWLPLVSRVLPSDVVRVRKRGACVRIDSSLRSFAAKSLEWQRGSVSAVLRGPSADGSTRCALHLLDHGEKAEGSLKERFERPSATTLAVATLQARQAEYVAASQPLVLGAETRALLDRRGDALRADVGPWRGCALFEMTGAKVRVVLKRNSRLCALRDDVQAAVDGAPADAADAAAAAAKGGGDGVHGGGSGDGEADDEVVAVARRVLSAESSLRPVKEALRALLAQPDPLTAGRALQDEDLLDDALATRVELSAGGTHTAAVRVPAQGAWVVRYHFLSEGHDIAYRLDFEPDSELDSEPDALAHLPGQRALAAARAQRTSVLAARVPDDGDGDGDGGSGGARAREGDGETVELFWTAQNSFDSLDDATPPADAPAAPAAGGAAASPAAALPRVPLRPLERAAAHMHARRGSLGPFVDKAGGRVLLTFSNEHSWMRGRAVRYRFTVVPAANEPPPPQPPPLRQPPPPQPQPQPPPPAQPPAPPRVHSLPPARAHTPPSGAQAAGSASPLGIARASSTPPGIAAPSAAAAAATAAAAGSNGDAADERDAMPFDEYFRLPPGARVERAHAAALVRRLPSSASETAVGAISLTMASDFPLALPHMLPLAQALAVSSRQHESLAAFFSRKLPAGFPVQFTLAVFPTVTATVTFGKAAVFPRGPRGEHHPDAPAADVFDLPADYARGAYRNFGERFLDG
ncbi:hypothetical protein KFE25_007258 [Diacronema lutheri]|uniref:Ankyrin repeat domain-containing protein n=1 Tax=Diacronema lutheri TaxID=2081491 RepID=A0A8J5X126_DIALT|nr:hypothetical protein KFE25_007258 [Diacronema lutheri]